MVSQFKVQSLSKRVKDSNYKHYLSEIRFEKIRALSSQKIKFDFPVTALIGTNGGGKSTVLGSAAIAYKSVKPSEYFPKSNVSDNSMADWRVSFDLIDREKNSNGAIQRSARFASSKWRRDDLTERPVIQFPIMRTVPAGEKSKYNKFQGINKIGNPFVEDMHDSVSSNAGRIIGRDISKYKKIKLSESDNEYIFSGERGVNDFSQFHFGAGEASIIEMVSQIESAPDYSLILIEEIENGLHPLATKKMVEYLIEVAERKKIQAIFTTHSNDALSCLPSDAIWACIDGKLIQGNLNIESLRAISGDVEGSHVIFVEDEFAKDWVEDMLRQVLKHEAGKANVHAAGGFPFVINVTDHHNKNPTIKSKAIAIIDGDQSENSQGTLSLPGSDPELTVWSYIYDNIDTCIGFLAQRCQISHLSQDEIKSIMQKTQTENPDPHLIFRDFGNNCGFVSEIVIRRGFISIYNEKNYETCDKLISAALSDS